MVFDILFETVIGLPFWFVLLSAMLISFLATLGFVDVMKMIMNYFGEKKL
jgi:hypothetical protein